MLNQIGIDLMLLTQAAEELSRKYPEADRIQRSMHKDGELYKLSNEMMNAYMEKSQDDDLWAEIASDRAKTDRAACMESLAEHANALHLEDAAELTPASKNRLGLE